MFFACLYFGLYQRITTSSYLAGPAQELLNKHSLVTPCFRNIYGLPILTYPEDRKEVAEAVGASEDHSDETGDCNTGEEGADYDNTRDCGHTHSHDTRGDGDTRCNAQEEWENQNQCPVQKAA